MSRATSHLCAEPGCANVVLDGPGQCEEHAVGGWARWKAAHGRRSGSPGYGAGWRRIRDAYLREHPDCEDCGQPAVEVHHVDGRSPLEPGANDWSNLRAVCVGCHRCRHHALRRARRAEPPRLSSR